MIITSKKYGFGFPYLIDETQQIAKNYGAVCTPTFMGLIPQENFSIEVDLMIAAHRKIIIQIKAICLKQCFRFQELDMDQKIKYLA